MRGDRRRASVLAATLLCVACVATREAPPLDAEARAAVAREASPKISVGVREPVLALDPAEPGGRLGADRYFGEVRQARRLIRLLRASGLFENVDFTRSLESPPELELVSLSSPERGSTPNEALVLAEILVAGASAGILPIVVSRDTGVRFARADAPDRIFEFSWPRLDVAALLGLSPVVAIGALPGWRFSYGLGLAETEEPVDGRFAEFLAAHRGELWAAEPGR